MRKLVDYFLLEFTLSQFIYFGAQVTIRAIRLQSIITNTSMRYSVLFIGTIFLVQVIQAQDLKKVDSLQKVLGTELSEKEKVDTYVEIAKHYYNQDSMAFIYTEKAMALAEKANYQQGIADIHYLVGVVYRRKGDYDQALRFYQKSLETAQESDHQRGISKAYNGLGIVSFQNGNYDQSREYFLKALEIDTKLGDQIEMAYDYDHVGLVYEAEGNYPEAIKYTKKSLEMHELANNLKGVAQCYNNISLILKVQGNYPEALEYLFKAQKIKEELGDDYALINGYSNIASIYTRDDDFKTAINYQLIALDIAKRNGFQSQIADTYNDLGNLYYRINLLDSSQLLFENGRKLSLEIKHKDILSYSYVGLGRVFLKKQEYTQALENFEKALVLRRELDKKREIASALLLLGECQYELKHNAAALTLCQEGIELGEEIKALQIQQRGSELLSKIYRQRGEYKKALDQHVLFKQLSDSLKSERNTREITRLEASYEYDKKEAELKQEQAEKEFVLQQQNQRNLIAFISGGVIILLIALFIYIQYRQRNKYAKKIEETMASKEKLFSVIAHDLKSPLSAFSSMSSTLAENIDAFQKEQVVTYLKKFEKSSQNLSELLNNLLQWSMSQTGSLSVHPETLDIKQAMENAVKPLTDLAESKGVKLSIESDELKATADSKMVETVIRNLVSNALKFTEKGGEVNVSSKQEGNQVFISVKDSGIGMDMEEASRLFNVKYDPSKIGDHEEKGTGLGLILSKELVEKNLGIIGVDSKKDKGSTFYFTLPSAA